MSNIPNLKKPGILINRPGKFKEQRWLTAHNAWNTEESPANQCKTITELLDYGVRGLAFDIYGSDEDSLYLQHGHGNSITYCRWKKIRDEIKTWLGKNPNDIVTLFFESYLTGPTDNMPEAEKLKTPLGCLNQSLKGIIGYVSGRGAQEQAVADTDIVDLIKQGKRLFAFIEKEPDEGQQSLFPVMRKMFTENDYGNVAMAPHTWVNLRPDSNASNPLGFLNHFGARPTGSEWDRNDKKTILKHASDFKLKYKRYPTFISLDYINWSNDNDGPIKVLEDLYF